MNSYMVLDNEMKLIQNKIYNYKAMNKSTQELEIKLESINSILNVNHNVASKIKIWSWIGRSKRV